MKKTLFLIKDKYLNESLDFRAQIFNMLALTGMILGVAIAASCFITNAGAISIVVNLLTSVLAFVMLQYVSRTGHYERCYLITVAVVFMIAFPILFFTDGGYHSGTPSFFIFAIVFTVFMVKGKRMVIMAALEIILYIGVCLIAYRYPQTVSFFETERDTVVDIMIGFTATGAALGITVFRHTKIYDKKQKQLHEANAALERMNQLKIEFLGNVSHELKTPLTVMSNYAQYSDSLLADEIPDLPKLHDNMRRVTLEAERMERMVNQLLDIAGLEQGGIALDMQSIPVENIIGDIASIHFPMLSENGNTLKLSVPPGLPEIRADRERLLQVLINLVSNASRHTKGGVITISVNQDSKNLAVTVADTGEGISPELLPKLFDRYPKAGSGRAEGTGLGLYICKRIIEAHGGRISIESAAGTGTTVQFSLPLKGDGYGE